MSREYAIGSEGIFKIGAAAGLQRVNIQKAPSYIHYSGRKYSLDKTAQKYFRLGFSSAHGVDLAEPGWDDETTLRAYVGIWLRDDDVGAKVHQEWRNRLMMDGGLGVSAR